MIVPLRSIELPWLLFCVGFTLAAGMVFGACFFIGVRAAQIFWGISL